MDGDAPGVDGGHAGWRDHRESLGRQLLYLLQKRCLSCAGLARQEDVPVGMQNKIMSELKLFVNGVRHSDTTDKYKSATGLQAD